MKITKVELKCYSMPMNPPFKGAWDKKPRTEQKAVICYIYCDNGMVGMGSGEYMVGFRGLEDHFVGMDPFDIVNMHETLDNIDMYYGRCWPFDIALWDLIGKICGQPVYKLLGGKTNRIKAYASSGEVVSVEERLRRVRHYVEKGFVGTKLRFHNEDVREDFKVLEAVRQEAGDDFVIMVDINRAWSMLYDHCEYWDLKKAIQVAREMEHYGVYWIEEPLRHCDFDDMKRLREATSIRLAAGEFQRRWHEYRDMCNKGCLDVYQPDAAYCGGITGLQRIAHMVQANGAMMSPHAWGNPISTMANLHVACGLCNCSFFEFAYDPPSFVVENRDFFVKEECRINIDGNGYLNLSDKPGLGLELIDDIDKYEVPSLGW